MARDPEKLREKKRRYRERNRERLAAKKLERERALRESGDDSFRQSRLAANHRYYEKNSKSINQKRTERRRVQAAEKAADRPPRLTPEERRARNIEFARRSNASRTTEDLARIREKRRQRRAEGRMPPSERWKLTPEGREAINAARRVVRAAARAARPRAVYSLPAPRYAGPSFPECAAPSPHRDMLLDVSSRVARSDDRDDIIGQAVLNVLEGMDVDEAVIRARRTVRAGTSHLRYSIPFHDCHFL